MPPGRHRSRRSATIAIERNVAIIEPSHVVLLAPILQFDKCELQYSSSGTAQRSTTTMRLHSVEQRDRLCIPAGLVPRVARRLREMGIDVTVHDHRRFLARPTPINEALFGRLNEEDRRLADAVSREPLGLIVVDSDAERMRCLALIALLYSPARMLVAVPTVAAARDTVRRLLPYFPGVSRYDSSRELVVVVTYAGLSLANPALWQILCFPDALSALGRQPREMLAWMDRHHVYACIAHDTQLDPRSALMLEATFGGPIYQAPASRPLLAQVRVQVTRLAQSPIHPQETALERKRHAIWHSDQRNRQIADLANGIANKDVNIMLRYGIDLSSVPSTLISPDVLLLVESPEHARQLARLLPEWRLVTGLQDSRVVGQQMPWLHAWQPGRHVIATLVAAATVGNLAPQVLIRTDGGQGGLELRGFPPRASQPQEIVLIDFDDEFDQQARRDFRSRVEVYRSQGFAIGSPYAAAQTAVGQSNDH